LSHPRYKSLYYPQIQTPVLYFVGNFDPVIPEDYTLKFAGRCKNRLVEYHPGVHFVPRGKIFQEAMLDFLRVWLRIDSREVAEVERKEGKT
jgi:pimeloyl-ACP methyl ester carboxylesterase